MTLTELIEAIQLNREQAAQAKHLIDHLNKEHNWLINELDEVRTREFNKEVGHD